MSGPEKACQTCHWFLWDEPTSSEGSCRRYPPVVTRMAHVEKTKGPGGNVYHEIIDALWEQPTVSSWLTCGEWSPIHKGES